MMYGPKKSDTGIVAEKPANKAVRAAAELVEPRPVTNGNSRGSSTDRTQCRSLCTRRSSGYGGPVAAVTPGGRSRMRSRARTDLCGGRRATGVPTATAPGMARSAVTGAGNRKAKANREVT